MCATSRSRHRSDDGGQLWRLAECATTPPLPPPGAAGRMATCGTVAPLSPFLRPQGRLRCTHARAERVSHTGACGTPPCPQPGRQVKGRLAGSQDSHVRNRPPGHRTRRHHHLLSREPPKPPRAAAPRAGPCPSRPRRSPPTASGATSASGAAEVVSGSAVAPPELAGPSCTTDPAACSAQNASTSPLASAVATGGCPLRAAPTHRGMPHCATWLCICRHGYHQLPSEHDEATQTLASMANALDAVVLDIDYSIGL